MVVLAKTPDLTKISLKVICLLKQKTHLSVLTIHSLFAFTQRTHGQQCDQKSFQN